MTGAYGQQTVVEVVEWLQRNEVDWRLREENWGLWKWLRAISRDDAPSMRSPFSSLVRELASTSVLLAKSPSHRALQSQAGRIEISPAEQSLLAHWRDPDDSTNGFDVVDALDLARSREIAFRAVSLLRTALTADEWSLVHGAIAPPAAPPRDAR